MLLIWNNWREKKEEKYPEDFLISIWDWILYSRCSWQVMHSVWKWANVPWIAKWICTTPSSARNIIPGRFSKLWMTTTWCLPRLPLSACWIYFPSPQTAQRSKKVLPMSSKGQLRPFACSRSCSCALGSEMKSSVSKKMHHIRSVKVFTAPHCHRPKIMARSIVVAKSDFGNNNKKISTIFFRKVSIS